MHHPFRGERRPVRHDKGLAAAAVQRRVAADVAVIFNVLAGHHPDDAGRLERCRVVDAHNAGEGVRRTHEIAIRLMQNWCVGNVATLAADQRLVLEARRVRGAAICFCIHVLFQMLCRDTAGSLITDTADG